MMSINSMFRERMAIYELTVDKMSCAELSDVCMQKCYAVITTNVKMFLLFVQSYIKQS